MKAENIDQVINHLDEIIEQAKADKSRLGYFAALYRKVTKAVQKGIEADYFDDGERMERLDVIFANRYLAAYHLYKSGGDASQSWVLAFEAAQKWRPTVLQHLFLGMNAHIDLDLGVAAAACVEGQEISTLREDFNKIDQILTDMLNEVQRDLAEVWPLLRVFDFAAGNFDETLSRFGISIARDRAWRVGVELAGRSPSEIDSRIGELDLRTRRLGQVILAPGKLLQTILLIVRLGEIGIIPQTIDRLAE